MHDFEKRLWSPPPADTVTYQWHDWPVPSEDEAMTLLLSMTQKHGAKINDILPILGRCNPCGRIMISSFAQTHLCPPESPPSSPTFLSKGKKLGLYSPGARHIDLPSTSQMRLTPLSPSESSFGLTTAETQSIVALHAASQSSQTTSSQVTYRKLL